MYSARLLEHFQNPRNVGELASPAVTVHVANPACGDEMRLSALVEDGAVIEARYKVRGCTASIACGSALCEWLSGRNVANMGQLRASDVEALVDGLAPESKHAAVLCVDAVNALLRALSSQTDVPNDRPP